jgi:hypothetical protein
VVVPGQGGSVIISPGSTTTTYGPAPGPDLNAHLPSSSRPIVGDQSDSFDLKSPNSGPTVVFGNKGAGAVLSDGDSSVGGQRPVIPEIHLVRRGDTLWDLCDRYYSNPWQWPRVWSYNPQVSNPHWIYPGDQIRMLGPGGAGALTMYEKFGASGGRGAGGGGSGSGAGKGLVDRRERLSSNTVVLRDQGFIGDPDSDNWGEVAGSVEEQMMLAEGNHVFLLMKSGKTVKPKDELTLYRSVRQPDKVKGARKPPGEIVAVLGTVKVESFNPETHIAKGRITESVDVIERGARVGPVKRRFDVVPPLPAQQAIRARVLTSVYPHVYLAQEQVVFLDRGSDDGLKPGHRLLILRHGDPWRASLGSKATGDRVIMDTPRDVEVERTPLPGEPEKFPEEVVAELRVLRAERFSSVALVTMSRREVVPGDLASTKPGF